MDETPLGPPPLPEPSSVLMVISRVPVPMRNLAICTDCDEFFELGTEACPLCKSGRGKHLPLAVKWEQRVLNVTGLN